MGASERLNETLKTLGYPVRRLAYKLQSGEAVPDTYIVFQIVQALPTDRCDDTFLELLYTFQVTIASRTDYTGLFEETLAKIVTDGYTLNSVGAETADAELDFYFIPINVQILEGFDWQPLD